MKNKVTCKHLGYKNRGKKVDLFILANIEKVQIFNNALMQADITH